MSDDPGRDELQILLPIDWEAGPEAANEQRKIDAAAASGFRLVRESFRFEWTRAAGEPMPGTRLPFRAASEIGRGSLVDLVARACRGTLDRAIADLRRRLGEKGSAEHLIAELEGMEVQPGWWQLAVDDDGETVGFVLPARLDGAALIGLIGVLPERRGRGYADELLACGTRALSAAGAEQIRADADRVNPPMCHAFERADYSVIGLRRMYARPSDRAAPRW